MHIEILCLNPITTPIELKTGPQGVDHGDHFGVGFVVRSSWFENFFFCEASIKKIIESENQAGESRSFYPDLFIYPFGRCFSGRAFSLLLLSFSWSLSGFASRTWTQPLSVSLPPFHLLFTLFNFYFFLLVFLLFFGLWSCLFLRYSIKKVLKHLNNLNKL